MASLKRINFSTHNLPFSQAVLDGQYCHLSGVLNTTDGKPTASSAEEETRGCMEAIKKMLNEVGLACEDLVRVTLYITDLKDFEEINKVYRTYFAEGQFPARTCIEVRNLIAGTRIEIEATAKLR
ncbi:Endoribonuclease L-PSP/chorismate mutase-like protein [Cladochytrium replicatum]|nr:Endoribonuclease L-PSP/chorismate mutase-like protein [Cladochytrium replicatum]